MCTLVQYIWEAVSHELGHTLGLLHDDTATSYTCISHNTCSAVPVTCVQYIWEAASHELGHTLGLLHDGVAPNPGNPAGTPYFWGQGNWAPIMVRG
jgi:predicted Zn-dependent protease